MTHRGGKMNGFAWVWVTKEKLLVRRDVYDLHHAILGLLFSSLITDSMTDATKYATGGHRPDFFWRSFPDGVDLFLVNKPTDIMSMKDWERLKIPFEKIDVATEKFKTCIGIGGYGWVYKGILSIDGKDTTVAVKRLNEQFGQGLKEFMTEIQLLSGQEHPNLISLVGYCDEGREKIIVYEYAVRGSLDRYIRRNRDESSTTLTWLERLKICTDAARGLDHLHNHIGGHRTIIHRDIKSSNILIDENWVAKISDLGLSKLSVTGFGMSVIISNGCGTRGYCEPEYYLSGVVTQKSDVYSFGIVLFEVLCGRLCIIEESDNGFILSGKSVKECYNKDIWVEIIDPSLREHLGSYSMTKFSEIAYRCLHDDREQRPAMDVVARELEETLNVQQKKNEVDIDDLDDEYWEKKLPDEYQRYIAMSDNCLSTAPPKRSSILVLVRVSLVVMANWFKENLRLGIDDGFKFSSRLGSFMFSPHYAYACYLVFKFEDDHVMSNNARFCKSEYYLGDNIIQGTIFVHLNLASPINIPTIDPKKDVGSRESSKSIRMPKCYNDPKESWVEKRNDGWMEIRLTEPFLQMENHDLLEVKLWEPGFRSLEGVIVEGIEFRPVLHDGSNKDNLIGNLQESNDVSVNV
ncbi:serine-threonine/tyrosine-protein kinase catalytic domain-containing protein [Artemisia annua]|uniref:Serine-threonine/tyrosine-protein kinase catalytic domain-containing protein n=1 Tax=Artemisia annua TaxID=35608 RepID=A0A2U1LDK8_ARTAN|nr:serine-threonine/tyrosine-protein kinase catalytic domain-containing protein [Artemisia annua]